MPATTDLQRRITAAPRFSPVRERDLVYLRGNGTDVLVVACDSDGSIGPKPNDAVPCPGYKLGRLAARVPLMELIAAGARPILVADTLAVEMSPTGEGIIQGVLAEVALTGLDADAVTGSTEDNVPTSSTGVGVTVLGHLTIERLRAGKAHAGDRVLLVGRPKSGPEDDFAHDDPEILDLPALQALMGLAHVKDIVPVGSSGVRYECDTLARSAGLRFVEEGKWPVPSDKSGGPATAAVAAATPPQPGTDLATWMASISQAVRRPVWDLGILAPL